MPSSRRKSSVKSPGLNALFAPAQARTRLDRWDYVVLGGSDPLEFQKRGIATAQTGVRWAAVSAGWTPAGLALRPARGLSTPAVLHEDYVHLTSVGWKRVRAEVKRGLVQSIRNGDAPATLKSFAQYEETIRPYLEEVDRLARGMGYEDDLGIDLPYVMVEPVFSCSPAESPDFKLPIVTVNHQGGGHACSQRTFRGFVLKLNDVGRAVADTIHREFEDHFGEGTWAELSHYQSILSGLGLSCERNFGALDGSVYPIDPEHVSRLVVDPLPADLADLADWRRVRRHLRNENPHLKLRYLQSLASLWERVSFKAYIVAENID